MLPGVDRVTGVGVTVEFAVPVIALDVLAVILDVNRLAKPYQFLPMQDVSTPNNSEQGSKTPC